MAACCMQVDPFQIYTSNLHLFLILILVADFAFDSLCGAQGTLDYAQDVVIYGLLYWY